MFKLILLILIVITSTYIGFSYGDKFTYRLNQLKEIQKILIILKNEIIYNNTALPDALFLIGNRSEKPFDIFLVRVSTLLLNGKCKDIKDGFKKAFNENKEKFFLSKEDKNIIESFSSGLDNINLYTQDTLFDVTMKNLEISINEANDISNKNVKVYRTLGFSIGVMIAIFLI